jgi:serine/threonine-protein kinase
LIEVFPHFFTPFGQELVFVSGNPGEDIGMFTVGSEAEPIWLLRETYVERNAELSPNGRWMAYESIESGTPEIYVRSFPNVDDDRIQISNAGGAQPLWSRDGSELFYLEADSPFQKRLMAVDVAADAAAFGFSARRALFDWPYFSNIGGRPYDVSLDGQHFLVLKNLGQDQVGTARKIIITQNWIKELKRLVPNE